MPISPGVYSSIIPLEAYVQEIPGSNAFIVALADKGPDNKLTFISSLEQLDKLFGKPKLSKYGKYAHALIIARGYVSVSPSLYILRPLPDNAKFANLNAILFIENPDDVDNNYLTKPVKIVWTSDNNITTFNDIENLNVDVNVRPVVYVKDNASNVYRLDIGNDLGSGYREAIFTPVTSFDEARDYVVAYDEDNAQFKAYNRDGEVTGITPYNKDTEIALDGNIYRLVYNATDGFRFQLKTTLTDNPQYETIRPLIVISGKYRGEWYNNLAINFEIYENRDDYIILNIFERLEYDTVLRDTFNVSFNPDAVDEAGESLYIKEVVNRFNEDLYVSVKEDDYLYLTNITKAKLVSSGKVIQVDKVIRFVSDLAGLPTGDYFIANRPGDWLTSYQGKILVGLNPSDNSFTSQVNIEYGDLVYDKSEDKLYIHTENGIIYEYDPYLYATLNNIEFVNKVFLQNGNDGDLINEHGVLNTTVADSLIAQAYAGEIDPDVKNTELYYIDLVLDAGYKTEIKNQIVTLASQIRRDCIAIIDNGDNPNPNEAINSRLTKNYYNTEYAALYEPYIKIYDKTIGANIWITPVYAVAKLIAVNDKVNEVWYAVAGFQRGQDPEILDTRYTPLLGDRDRFYLNQINPFVKFKEGQVLWGQLTTRRKSDALQDLNVMRLILYIDRAIKQFSRYEIFEFIDTETIQRIESAIKAFLTDVQRRRGLYGFDVQIIADEDMRRRKAIQVNITLQPTRALERIFLNYYIK